MAIPRWGQAVAVINDALFVYGGKTDPHNTFGYGSAPWNNDLLYLPLSTPFDSSNPPWQYLSGSQNPSVPSQGPTLAWHTLSAFNSSFCLLFGGNTDPLSTIVLRDNNDSAELLNVADLNAPTFLPLPNNWSGEPQRRMRHATASLNGSIYIIGGEAADGSGNTFSTHFVFTPSVPSFVQLPSANAPPGIFGHAAVILFDGRLLVFGGISQGNLLPFNTIWILDTTKPTLTWALAFVDGSNLPSPRASFATVLLNDGRILIHGGTDANFQSNFADGWILDPSKIPMVWTSVPALSQVGPRRDHFAVGAGGGQVMFGFGFGHNAPAGTPLQVYDVDSSTFRPTFSPMTAPPAHPTLPPDPSQTITDPPGSFPTSGKGNTLAHPQPGQSRLSAGQSRPSAGHSQPSTGQSRPSAGHSQPSAGHSQSSAGQSRPSAGHSQTSAGHSQPSAGQSQPSTAQSQPSTTQSQPSTAQSQPSTTQSQPSTTQSQPSTGQSQPSGSSTGTGGTPSSTSTSTSIGGGGHNAPGKTGGSHSDSDTLAIVLGTVLGALGLAALIALIVWYLRRRRAQEGHAFSPLDEDDEEQPHSITAVRLAGTRETGPRRILAVLLGILGMIGLGRSRRYINLSRRDILADEDRSIEWVNVSREGSVSYGGPSARSSIRGLSHAITERFASIRNLARGAGSVPHSRVPTSATDWEKMDCVPFSPEVALMADGLARDELPERTRDGFPLAGPSEPYFDPYAELNASTDTYLSEPEPERKEARPTPTPIRTALPAPAEWVPLSPLVEQASQNSLSISSSSHHSNSDPYGSASSHGATLSPRPSSILDPNPPQPQPIRRTNSWWARFAKQPLRAESSTRTPAGFIDIRDPNPPPRMLTIKESTHSQRSSFVPPEATQVQQRAPAGSAASRALLGTPSRRPTLYHDTAHGRSATSLQTAITETLEQLGGTMDIIQRDGTVDSQHTPLTGAFSVEDDFGVSSAGGTQQSRPPLIVRSSPSTHSARTASSSISLDLPILSPPASGVGTPTDSHLEPSSPPPLPPPPEHPEETVSAGGEANGNGNGSPHSPAVAERVRGIERRMSLENAPPPPPTNTRSREERRAPMGARPSVRYGLVPRASLFVANPDGSRGGSEGGS